MNIRYFPILVIAFKVIKFMFYDVGNVHASTINPYEEMKKGK